MWHEMIYFSLFWERLGKGGKEREQKEGEGCRSSQWDWESTWKILKKSACLCWPALVWGIYVNFTLRLFPPSLSGICLCKQLAWRDSWFHMASGKSSLNSKLHVHICIKHGTGLFHVQCLQHKLWNQIWGRKLHVSTDGRPSAQGGHCLARERVRRWYRDETKEDDRYSDLGRLALYVPGWTDWCCHAPPPPQPPCNAVQFSQAWEWSHSAPVSQVMVLLHSVDRLVWCLGLQDSLVAIGFVPLLWTWLIHLSTFPDVTAVNRRTSTHRGNRISQANLDQTSLPK